MDEDLRGTATRVALAGVLALVLPGTASGDVLVVLNKSDHDAALVDPASLEVLVKLPTGRGPHEVAVSPDGRLAYVANYGVFGVFRDSGERRAEPGNSLTVLDLVARRGVRTIDLGEYSRPHGIAVSRDGRWLWVTCEGAQAVVEVDADAGTVRRAWRTDQEVSHMLVPTPDERKLYVANIRSGSVTVIDREHDAVTSVPTGAGAEGIDVSPDGREVWVTNRGANTLSILAVDGDSVVATLDSGGRFPIRAKFTPDGRQVWVANAQSNAVAVFDAARRALVDSIAVGAMPVGIQMSPDGRRAFVANTNDNLVTVIDVGMRRVRASFTTGNEPDGMAWSRARTRR